MRESKIQNTRSLSSSVDRFFPALYNNELLPQCEVFEGEPIAMGGGKDDGGVLQKMHGGTISSQD